MVTTLENTISDRRRIGGGRPPTGTKARAGMAITSTRVRSRGFTIVELLVAGAITVALALILVSIVGNVLASSGRTIGKVTSSNQARVALDYLAQDLESAVFAADEKVWLAVTIQPDQSGTGDANPAWGRWQESGKPGANARSLRLFPAGEEFPAEQQPLNRFRFGMAGVWLRLISVEPDRNDDLPNLSAPRAISYQIIRVREESDGAARYCLFRSSVHPDNTFDVGYDLFAAQYNTKDGVRGHAGNIRTPPMDALVAANVVDFGIRFWGRDSGGDEVVLFPSSSTNCGFAITSRVGAVPLEPTPLWSVEDATMSSGYPEFAEIFLRVLTDAGAVTIENLELGKLGPRPTQYATDGDWWWAEVERNSDVYTRRVELKANLYR